MPILQAKQSSTTPGRSRLPRDTTSNGITFSLGFRRSIRARRVEKNPPQQTQGSVYCSASISYGQQARSVVGMSFNRKLTDRRAKCCAIVVFIVSNLQHPAGETCAVGTKACLFSSAGNMLTIELVRQPKQGGAPLAYFFWKNTRRNSTPRSQHRVMPV